MLRHHLLPLAFLPAIACAQESTPSPQPPAAETSQPKTVDEHTMLELHRDFIATLKKLGLEQFC